MTDPGMKAVRSRRPGVVRDRILDAAQAEFMAEGFAGASTNRMLLRFGGSKPTMFRHYPTKRDLFRGVVERIAARWEQAVDWPAIDSAAPRLWLEAFAARALAWITTPENLFVGRMAIAEGANFPEVADTYRSVAVEPIEAVLAERLRAWTAADLLVCADASADATAFLDLVLSGVVSRALYGVQGIMTRAEVEVHVRTRVGLFLNGRRRLEQARCP